MIYAFVEAEKTNHRVNAMCRTLKVSKCGFYGWSDRPPSARAKSDAALSEKIVRIHKDSRETYGAPRVHFELRTLGVRCARKRVARLMREAGCSGAVAAEGKSVAPSAHRPSALLLLQTSREAQLYPRGSKPPVGCGHHLRQISGHGGVASSPRLVGRRRVLDHSGLASLGRRSSVAAIRAPRMRQPAPTRKATW